MWMGGAVGGVEAFHGVPKLWDVVGWRCLGGPIVFSIPRCRGRRCWRRVKYTHHLMPH